MLKLSFEEKEPYEQGFAKYFEQKIKPIIADIEDFRLKQLAKINQRRPWAIAAMLIVAGLGVYLINLFGTNDILIVVGFLLLSGIYSWAFVLPKKAYHYNFKDKLIPLIIKFFDGFEFHQQGQIPRAILQKSNIVPNFDRYNSEDYVSGKHRQIKFDFAETELARRVRTRRGSYYVTVFKGVLLLIEMPKKFSGQTYVSRDRGKLGNFFKRKLSSLKKVSLEDPLFEKKFEVYAGSQIEARYLLTTAFMERLLGLEKIYNENGGKGKGALQCAFFDNKVFITIPSDNNLFEPQNIKKSAINTDDFHRFLKEIQQIFKVIDELKLYRRTGL